jgi:hypothetical protein
LANTYYGKTEKLKMSNSISRQIHERVLITGGRDYIPPIARVIQSTYKNADDNEKAIYIAQGKNGISISLATLEAILLWARGENL